MKRIVTTLTTVIFGLCSACTALAASLQVYPVNITFSAGENAKAVYVKNTGTAPIGAQLRAYQWTQQGQTDVLTETHALLLSPPITSIPAGQQQLIRVILPVPPAQQGEQAYKLVVDELPGTQDDEKRAVRFLLRYNLPVFVNTPAIPLNLSLMKFHLDTTSSPARLWIENNSSQHLKLSNVVLVADDHKHPLFNGLLGYVLANSSRSWPLPKGHYAGSTLTFNVNDDAVTQSVPLILN